MPRSRFVSNLPNLITIMRLFLVPLIIDLIVNASWTESFLVFVFAGLSDAVDGFLARHLHLRTELGAYLDPLADKALLVSIYVTLSVVQVLPVWITILVVARDVMIMGAVVISWLMAKPVEIRPLFISKANTAAQIGLAAFVLAGKASGISFSRWLDVLIACVFCLTVASTIAYLTQWFEHMNADQSQ